MSEKSEPLSGSVNARRRLLRGVFAAPVVLPLHSGAQTAVASNQRCIQRQVGAPESPPAVDSIGSNDTWVRVRLYTLSYQKNQNSPISVDSNWVNGSDLTTLANAHGVTSTLVANNWQCYNAAPDSAYKPTDPPLSTAPTRQDYKLQQNGAYVAVRVDANGNIVGVVPFSGSTGSGSSAIHNSCWTSFKPLR